MQVLEDGASHEAPALGAVFSLKLRGLGVGVRRSRGSFKGILGVPLKGSIRCYRVLRGLGGS